MSTQTGFASLRRFARVADADVAVERCELCHAAISPRHEHLVAVGADAPAGADLRCACVACALLFSSAGARFARVVPRARRLPDDVVDDAAWASLGVPVGLAYFCTRGTSGEVVAYLPGTAGATLAHPPAEAWAALRAGSSAVAAIAPDVEALLVDRIDGARAVWHVSLDVCHQLATLVRLHGRDAGVHVRGFLAGLAGGAHG